MYKRSNRFHHNVMQPAHLRYMHASTPLCLCIVSTAQSCGPPPIVQNAQVQTTGETYLHNASYVCNAGLQLVGPKTLMCLSNGTWSLPAPTCEGIEDGPNPRQHPSALSSFFSELFNLSFFSVMSVAKGCNSPKQMLHGKVQERNLNTGRAVEFQCDKGYNLVGEPVVVCIGGNSWSSTFPTCQRESPHTETLTLMWFACSRVWLCLDSCNAWPSAPFTPCKHGKCRNGCTT